MNKLFIRSNGFLVPNKKVLLQVIKNNLQKVYPAHLKKSPVFLLMVLGTLSLTILCVGNIFAGATASFSLHIALWLWLTVLIINFPEAIVAAVGKVQSDNLIKTRDNIVARAYSLESESIISANKLHTGDYVVCEAGNVIPLDGVIVEGMATIDESAITGESAPVLRESIGENNSVSGGTLVLSDRIVIRITTDPGQTYFEKLIGQFERAKARITIHEKIHAKVLLVMAVLLFAVIASFYAGLEYSHTALNQRIMFLSVPVFIALFICLIPTATGGIIKAIEMAGMDRLLEKNIVALSDESMDAAGNLDVIFLDKTGAITLGNRSAVDFIPAPGVKGKDLAVAAQLASLADETTEGRSIVILAKTMYGIRGQDIKSLKATFIHFSPQTQISGVDLQATDDQPARIIRKGSMEAIKKFLSAETNVDLTRQPDYLFAQMIGLDIALEGGTPLIVVENKRLLGLIQLNDRVRGGIKDRLAKIRKMGIRTIMITGDNRIAATAIAAEAGVDDFIAEAGLEDKLRYIRAEQVKGNKAGIIGKSIKDAPALALADVGIAMNNSSLPDDQAGNMIDLDNNPTKLIDVVEIGKQVLMTRKALTVIGIITCITNYFAAFPAVLAVSGLKTWTTVPLSSLNVLHLETPQSAIQSMVIWNALSILGMTWLTQRGIKFRSGQTSGIMNRQLFIYGLGCLFISLLGIKLIDSALVYLNLI